MAIKVYNSSKATFTNNGQELFNQYVLEKNFTIQHDGFGLVTMQMKFTADSDKAADVETDFPRGSAPSFADLNYLTLHRAVAVTNDGLCTVTADYCGIKSGDSTVTQVQVVSATAQEAIETHPNFTKVQCERISKEALAGPAAYIYANESDASKNPNKAHFALVTTASGQQTQYQFVGFLPSRKPEDDVNIKAGIKSYFKPGVTLRCLAYTNNAELAKKTIARVGWANYGNIGAINLPAPYNTLLEEFDKELPLTLPPKQKRNRTYLCTNASVEVFGGLYKVQADLMMSGIIGWDTDIYPLDTTKPKAKST